jgi:hypothetical protein
MKGLQLVIDGTEAKAIREILDDRHSRRGTWLNPRHGKFV